MFDLFFKFLNTKSVKKIFLIIILVALGIFIFGLISKGGFGPPPEFLGGKPPSKQPPCPDPLVLETPVDMNKVTSILYPGQERGGDFKPHGGFRFDNSKPDEIVIRAPIDAKLQDASGYIEQDEVQYMFDFANPCGIIYRLDHLLTLSPELQTIAKDLKIIDEQSWKTGNFNSSHLDINKIDITVKKGDVIATAVGFRKSNNTFVDFGVYDLRGRSLYQNPRPYAVCWFDFLSPEDSAKVKSLPSGDSQNGKKSAYCK